MNTEKFIEDAKKGFSLPGVKAVRGCTLERDGGRICCCPAGAAFLAAHNGEFDGDEIEFDDMMDWLVSEYGMEYTEACDLAEGFDGSSVGWETEAFFLGRRLAEEFVR